MQSGHDKLCNYCVFARASVPDGCVVPEPRGDDDRRGLSEEKRQQLLLQKMELEVEKERLQHLLAQQETQLLLKQQQLHQSRLDYNRWVRDNPCPVTDSQSNRGRQTAEQNRTKQKQDNIITINRIKGMYTSITK
uniref:KIAA1328 n=1 Tax=Ornithorhynchus anatinus TaxID=9258 RepID=A0A6I8P5N2_ORNAN